MQLVNLYFYKVVFLTVVKLFLYFIKTVYQQRIFGVPVAVRYNSLRRHDLGNIYRHVRQTFGSIKINRC